VSVLFVRWDSLGGSGQSGVLLWVVKDPTSEHGPFIELQTAFTLRKTNTHTFRRHSSFKIIYTTFKAGIVRGKNNLFVFSKEKNVVHSRCTFYL